MTPELSSLTWVLVINLLCWIPYIINRVMVQGLVEAVGYPDDPRPLAPWADRAKRAHYNAVENLVVFGSAVLILHAVGISNETTALACSVYFWARLVHYVVYTLGIPWVRTLSYAVAWLCNAALVLQLL